MQCVLLTRCTELIGVGSSFEKYRYKLNTSIPQYEVFENTEALLQRITPYYFERESILVKGARKFHFEDVIKAIELQSHKTILEVNLNNLVANLNIYKNFVKDETGIIAMVKAFSYGSGSVEIAQVLQKENISYLAVAYADEGTTLRKAGIVLPIIVMSSDANDLEQMIKYDLEAEVHSTEQIKDIINELKTLSANVPLPVHLKIDTGMNRLGVLPSEINVVSELLSNSKIKVKTIFSHLAASEDASHDSFTFEQQQMFKEQSQSIIDSLKYPIKRHLLNSSGIVRFTGAQYDYVRVGIGMYGVDSTSSIQERLHPVGFLKTRIIQVKKVSKGNTIGYSRKGVAHNDAIIAVIPIGYADGYDRRFSNGKGEVFIKGIKAKVIGNVCMDMTMIDVTSVENVKVGDEVEIYGKNISIVDMAERIGTIPYELLTHISERVKRVYIRD